VDRAEVGALGDQGRPDLLHHAVAAPALEPAVDGAVVAELLGELVPLAAAAQAEEDAVQGAPPVGALAPGGLGRGVLQEDGLDALPEVVGDLPDGVQLLRVRHGGARNQEGNNAELEGQIDHLDSCFEIIS
jgi:hypothetical protein